MIVKSRSEEEQMEQIYITLTIATVLVVYIAIIITIERIWNHMNKKELEEHDHQMDDDYFKGRKL